MILFRESVRVVQFTKKSRSFVRSVVFPVAVNHSVSRSDSLSPSAPRSHSRIANASRVVQTRVLNGPENYNPTRPGPWLSKPEPDVTRDINMNYLPEPGPRPEAEFSHVILWRLAVPGARSGARSAHADFRYDR